jgi:arylsulfatase A-like enzyme
MQILEEGPDPEETIVVLMADHGEAFYDHAKVGHGSSLYDELIRVPLILAGRGIPEGRRIEAPVQNIDVLPTLVELAGETARDAQGRSLVPYFQSGAKPEPQPAFSETRRAHAVIDGRWKGIFRAGKWRLYDILADPHERSDLAGDPAMKVRLERLAELLRKFTEANHEIASQRSAPAAHEIPDEVIERMKALGYMRTDE